MLAGIASLTAHRMNYAVSNTLFSEQACYLNHAAAASIGWNRIQSRKDRAMKRDQPLPQGQSLNQSSSADAHHEPVRAARLAWLLPLLLFQLGAATRFDFTQADAAGQWQGRHDVEALKSSPEGLLITISGEDPYLDGPPIKSAIARATMLRMRVKSDAGGIGKIFWFQNKYSENQSVSFSVPPNAWADLCIPLPAMEKGTRFRFDPPGTAGTSTLAWMDIEELGATGITQIVATPEQLEFKVNGLQGEVEFAELAPNQPLSDAVTAPVLHRANVNGSGKFLVPRFEKIGDAQRDRIYSAFVPLQSHPKHGSVPVGAAHFVNEFSGVSKFNRPFPEAKSKKGLQIQMVDDAIKLGVQHAALNVDLSRVVDLTRSPTNIPWVMDGETYYFQRDYVQSLPVKELTNAGCTVSLILLSYQTGNPQIDSVMLHPKRAEKLPNRMAAFNTATPDGLRHYKACLEFLADRFSQLDGSFGRVANYIVGNEVSAHFEWYNLGLAPREVAIENYERSVRLFHTAIRKYSSTSRVYLSLEHHWTLTFGGNPMKAVAGKRFLEEFNRRARMGGNFDWHLAYHPYPENLFEPRFWRDKSAVANMNSPRITFKNLDQLTRFFRQQEMQIDDKPRRIILSEQGFHSDNTADGDAAQAAAYCYAWKKVEALDGIDSFILHRHIDHSAEGGLNLGLWRRQPDSIATPSTPRPMYEVFQKADSPDWEAAFQFALPIIGIKNWNQAASTRP